MSDEPRSTNATESTAEGARSIVFICETTSENVTAKYPF